jgi:hypothetical protein
VRCSGKTSYAEDDTGGNQPIGVEHCRVGGRGRHRRPPSPSAAMPGAVELGERVGLGAG